MIGALSLNFEHPRLMQHALGSCYNEYNIFLKRKVTRIVKVYFARGNARSSSIDSLVLNRKHY